MNSKHVGKIVRCLLMKAFVSEDQNLKIDPQVNRKPVKFDEILRYGIVFSLTGDQPCGSTLNILEFTDESVIYTS